MNIYKGFIYTLSYEHQNKKPGISVYSLKSYKLTKRIYTRRKLLNCFLITNNGVIYGVFDAWLNPNCR
jgi:hypothetical protein